MLIIVRNFIFKILLLFFFSLLVFCTSRTVNNFISIQGDRFIDDRGNQIILHGVNLVNKDKSVNYLGSENENDFKLMRSWGMNCIRLGIIWDGLEPQPGVYDDDYLEGIDKRIEWAKQNGLYVILDMHQDLFSVKFSDGAPEWATLTDDKEHIHNSPVWSDAYNTSPAIQTAFDNFWNNKPASDGMGIQDHYAKAWQYVATRYANEPTIVGYDIMNEPFIGSKITEIQPLLFFEGAKIFAEQDSTEHASVEELLQMWMTEEGRYQILQRLANPYVYARVIAPTEPGYQEFEKHTLTSMYQRVANDIRKVDQNHILFLETTIASNMGVRSGLEPLVDSLGNRDPLQAYAPHGYDLVTDTKDVALASNERLDLIFSRHEETSKRLLMPMLVGEWGAYYMNANAKTTAMHVSALFEKMMCGDTYWSYNNNLPQADFFEAISRIYPAHVPGELLFYSSDTETNIFHCRWLNNPEINGSLKIYIPSRYMVSLDQIECIPGNMNIRLEIEEGSESNYIIAKPARDYSDICTITFRLYTK